MLRVLLVDVDRDADLPDLPGVVPLSTEALGLGRREVQRLATIYDLVEFATAVKPVLLRVLLEQTEQVSYLDPDTYPPPRCRTWPRRWPPRTAASC